MKYIDPEYDLPEIKANPETPAEGSDFGSRFPLPWKEETIELTPIPMRHIRSGTPSTTHID